jgi:alpha-N-arabinofuranosidase
MQSAEVCTKTSKMKNRNCILIMVVLCIASLQLKAQKIVNPILAGFYPDPSICKAGNDYYLINSSFAYYPGLPIFHSKDLLNWKQIGHVLNRPEQLNLDGAGVSRGLFAPSISYHNGVFYVICTLVDKGGNFVVTAKDPKGPWSNPVWLPQINGIDPSIFFDEDDKAYILYNSIPPDNISKHDGHRTIRMNEFDYKNLKVISDNRIIVNGGTDMAKKPVWIEGPHIFKKDGKYYLICAEGGTGYNHSEVVFKSVSVDSPFIAYAKNPILTQRHLDTARKAPITTTGHAQFVQGKDGQWWGVFLGCRPYKGDYYNTGRETFMAPVEWKDGWPVFNLGGEEVKYSYPIHAKQNNTFPKFSGNYYFKDEFKTTALNNRFVFLRTVKQKWYSISSKGLTVQLQPATCSEPVNPSFIGFRQAHNKGYAATSFEFTPKSTNEKAGLIVFQNEHHYYYLCKSLDSNGNAVIQLFKGNSNKAENNKPVLLASTLLSKKTGSFLQLKISAEADTYSFYYAQTKNNWQLLMNKVDATFLSTKVAGGFVGCMYGMYATSNGIVSTNAVIFKEFESNNVDDIHK